MGKFRMGKGTKKAAILAVILLTATTVAVITATSTQNQNQITYPLTSLYLQSVSQSPNNAIILPKYDIDHSITFDHDYTETINVTADNIVIDGNGHTVQGPADGTGWGFNLTNRHNVTIKNVKVTGWLIGFFLDGSSNITLSGNTANNNTGYGFDIYFNSNNNTLLGNTANNNNNGFLLYFNSNNTLSGNNANNNTYYGFYLYSSSNNTLTNNNANNNTYYGFYLYSSSNNNTLSGNTANNTGFFLDGSSNNTLSGNTANNTFYGFGLNSSSYNNLTGNNANNNTYGFYLASSSNNTLSGNNANNNTKYGFYLAGSSNNNTLSGNNANNNLNIGFYLYQSSNNTLSDNTATNSGNYGFYLAGASTGNKLPSNTALNTTTGGYGYNWTSDCINNDFTGSVEAYYLRVNAMDTGGLPLSGVDVEVETDGTIVYSTSHFGGSGAATDSNGFTPWIAVTYRTFTTNDTLIENNTNVTVWYSTLWSIAVFSSNPRTVDMSMSHMENFQVESWQPTMLKSLLPLLLLLSPGMQGGVSPLIYVVGGIAVVGVVIAAVLLYHFRRT